MKQDFIFIDKTVFFPKHGILAVGDLHLGYEHILRSSGINLPETQTKSIIENLNQIFSEINKKDHKLKKIIFLGDIKHYFRFEYQEKYLFNKFLEFLKKHLKDKDIILIKGNHDKIEYSGKKMKDYYIKNRIAFLHGHKNFPQLEKKKDSVDFFVTGHLHPSITISDKSNIKREKFKCFLVGKYNKKRAIILPSFFDVKVGTDVNNYKEDYERDFSIIPKKSILKFQIFVIGKNQTYDFGKVENL